MIVINSLRLKIRPHKKSDFFKWKEGFSGLSKKRNRWDWESLPQEKLTKDFFYKQIEANTKNMKNDSNYRFAVFEKKTGKLIGYTLVMVVTRGIYQSAFIGYQLLNPYWGQGLGREMVFATVKMAFKKLKLHRLEAQISPNNRRSIRLIKDLGFRKEGRSKGRLNLSGKWSDVMVYALTKDEFVKK